MIDMTAVSSQIDVGPASLNTARTSQKTVEFQEVESPASADTEARPVSCLKHQQHKARLCFAAADTEASPGIMRPRFWTLQTLRARGSKKNRLQRLQFGDYNGCIYIYIYIYIYLCIFLYIYNFLNVYIYIYMYIYIS